jgi:type II secretory pathway pseudopilin PulG
MIMTTAINKRRIIERLTHATMFCLLALAAVLYQAREAHAQWVTNGNNINNTNTGNVGIGTSTPGAPLEINKSQNAGTSLVVDNSYTTAGNAAFSGVWFKQGGANRFFVGTINDGNTTQVGGPGGVQFWNYANGPTVFSNNNAERMRITGAGNVGIGTTNPQAKLDVQGNVSVTGNISATGNIAAKYQDVAEWVPSRQKLAAHTVVVLDPEQSNNVRASTSAYDMRVAGVVSAAPGVILGEGGEGKVMVATTGRVKVKVDATRAPIRVGDLLVTSDIPGVAMRSEPVNIGGIQLHRPGTLIGKALEPLAKGEGEILVLLSLQ